MQRSKLKPVQPNGSFHHCCNAGPLNRKVSLFSEKIEQD